MSPKSPKIPCPNCKGTGVVRHGVNAYRYHGCRCDTCVAANYAQVSSWREKVKGNPPRHGVVGGYTNYGCRCVACTKAHTDYYREYHAARRARAAS